MPSTRKYRGSQGDLGVPGSVSELNYGQRLKRSSGTGDEGHGGRKENLNLDLECSVGLIEGTGISPSPNKKGWYEVPC